jgi:hypothetical protein
MKITKLQKRLANYHMQRILTEWRKYLVEEQEAVPLAEQPTKIIADAFIEGGLSADQAASITGAMNLKGVLPQRASEWAHTIGGAAVFLGKGFRPLVWKLYLKRGMFPPHSFGRHVIASLRRASRLVQRVSWKFAARFLGPLGWALLAYDVYTFATYLAEEHSKMSTVRVLARLRKADELLHKDKLNLNKDQWDALAKDFIIAGTMVPEIKEHRKELFQHVQAHSTVGGQLVAFFKDLLTLA